jgi:hypothetical protein
MRGLRLHNIVNKASALNLNLDLNQFSHIDVEYVYTIKAAYDKTFAAKMKAQAKGYR